MGWTLADIRNKIRNLTGSPSNDQITDSDIDTYINNYYVFTMPFELKEQITNQFLSFKTTPGINVYGFPGAYFTDQPGAYADGFPLIFYQDPDIFYQDWPLQYAVDNIATGTGAISNFSGGLQSPPIIIGSLFIAADDPTGFQQIVQDQGNAVTQTIATGSGITGYNGTLTVFPIESGSLTITDSTESFVDNSEGVLTGNLGGTGTINYSTGAWAITFNTAVPNGVSIVASYESTASNGVLSGNGAGTVNYLTGAYNITFDVAPASTAIVYAKYQGYSGNRPQGVLFYNNEFTFMPVPDQAYQIQMQGYIKPVFLVNDADKPLQEEWGPLIAYAASIEIFSDRGDEESYNAYFPIFKRYENVALGRTIQQLTVEQSVPRF